MVTSIKVVSTVGFGNPSLLSSDVSGKMDSLSATAFCPFAHSDIVCPNEKYTVYS